ncbi:MAG: response regulator [Pseudobdellovibrio sp.]
MSAKKIVIVDDEKDLLEALRETLEIEGFDVTSFERVDDAIVYLQNNQEADLVISDMRMPTKNGLDLALAIRRDLKLNMPFVMISGFADITPQQLAEAKIIDFIPKPFALSTFIQKINMLLKT